MNTNVVSLTQFRREASEFVRLEGYQIGNETLIQDPCTQIARIRTHAVHMATMDNGQEAMLEAFDLQRLLTITAYLLDGIIPPFGMAPTFGSRRHKKTKDLSIYIPYFTLEESKRVIDAGLTPEDVERYMTLCVEYHPDEMDNLVHRPLPAIPEFHDNAFDKYKTRMGETVYKRMLELAHTHYGKTNYVDDIYVAFLPFSPKSHIRISLTCIQFKM